MGQDKDQQQTLFDKLQTAYFEVASKEADALAKYGSNNPTIISLRNQKTQLQVELNEEFQRIKESSGNDYNFLQTREVQIQKEYDTAVAQSQEISHAQVKLRELEASATAYQDLYNTFVNRYNASLQEAASPVAEASVISPASALIQAGPQEGPEVCRDVSACGPGARPRDRIYERDDRRQGFSYKQVGTITPTHPMHWAASEGEGGNAVAPSGKTTRQRW